MNSYQYKAFISYRHTDVDQEIAKKLHSLIENYGIPTSLKKSLGIKKMGRVFRDQEELPLSADLGSDIHTALENSEWLICICSPRFLESKWCAEEVNYFISLGKKDHILAVLVEGEPETAFPLTLRFETIDGKVIEKEPLAADVRADSLVEALNKLRNEKLRILAPMLGVNYDDLKQRARKRRTRLIVIAVSIAFVILSIFLTYAIIKNKQITAQRNESMVAESKWLAKSAFEAIDDNNPTLALELALEALPSEEQERPIVDEAINALYSSLFLKAHDNYEVLYGVDSSNLKLRGYEDVYVMCNDNFLYLYSEDCWRCYEYDLLSGEFIRDVSNYGYSYKTYLSKLEEYYDAYLESEGIFANLNYGRPIDYKTMYSQDKHESSLYAADNELVALEDDDNNRTLLLETYNGEIIHSYIPSEQYVHKYYGHGQYHELTEIWGLLGFGSSYDGRVIYLLNGYDLYLFEESSEEIIKVINYQDVDGYYFCGSDISNDQALISLITTGGKGYIYNYLEDNFIEFQNENHTVDSVKFNSDGSRVLALSKATNTCDVYSTKTGEMLLSFSADFEIESVDYGFKDSDFITTSDNYIIISLKDYVQVLRNSGSNNSNAAVTVMADAYSKSWNYESTPLINNDGSLVWSIRQANTTIAAADRDYRLTAYEVKSGEIVYDHQIDILMNNLEKANQYLINYGHVEYPKDQTTESYPAINIYGIDSGEQIYELKPQMKVDGKEAEYSNISDVIVNDDGTLLYALGLAQSGFYRVKLSSADYIFVYDLTTGELLWDLEIEDSNWQHNFYDYYVDFVDNTKLRVYYDCLDDEVDLVYYDAYTGEIVDYEENAEDIKRNDAKKAYYNFNNHKVIIEGTSLIDFETKEKLIEFGKEVVILDEVDSGNNLLITYYADDADDNNTKGQLYILNALENKEIIAEAYHVLDGKTLNEEQRKNYFLDD